MRVIISINTSWNIYNFRSGLVRFLQQNGHEVIAIAPNDAYSQRLIDELGIAYYPIEIDNKGTNPVKDFKLILAYRNLFKSINPDVILQYTIKPNIYGTIAAKQLNIPTINNVSGLGTIFIHPHSFSSRIGKILYKYAFQFPKKVFFQNEDDRNLFVLNKLIAHKKTDVLPGSGVDLTKFTFEPKQRTEKFVFLMIARILTDKGINEYVSAAKKLKQNGINADFQLLGKYDGSKGSVQKNTFTAWINSQIINYLGTTDDVFSVIKSADAVVLPSYREGTPKTLLEALAVGRPIIATNVAGCKDVVIDNENGYLCEVKNSTDLALKMMNLLKIDDNKRIQMGKKSRELAESKFDEKYVFEKYLAEINGIQKN